MRSAVARGVLEHADDGTERVVALDALTDLPEVNARPDGTGVITRGTIRRPVNSSAHQPR